MGAYNLETPAAGLQGIRRSARAARMKGPFDQMPTSAIIEDDPAKSATC